MRKIYFGHPISFYNTPVQSFLIDKISLAFPETEIVNPGLKIHGENYKKWKAETGNGMNYFFQEVLPSCAGGVFLPFEDGMFGAGVFGEAKFLSGLDRLVCEIDFEGSISPFTLDESRCLSVEETRKRVYPVATKTN
jgi:hypothetical protein